MEPSLRNNYISTQRERHNRVVIIKITLTENLINKISLAFLAPKTLIEVLERKKKLIGLDN